MEDITLSITETIACELALDEVLEGLRASAVRRKEGLTDREVALEKMLAATRRSVGAKRQAAEYGYGRATVDPRDIVVADRIPGGVDLAGGKDEVGAVRILPRHGTSAAEYRTAPLDVHLEPGEGGGE